MTTRDIKALIRKINAGHKGDPFIQLASDSLVMRIPRYRTGIFSLDVAIGGGIPAGRFIRLFGPESSGKTLVSLLAIANNQHICANCWGARSDLCCDRPTLFYSVWLDLEGTWDGEWATTLGVNLDQIILIRPETTELGLDAFTHWIQSRTTPLLVVDSLANVTPSREFEDTVEKENISLSARLLNKTLRIWGQALSQYPFDVRRPTIILINQVRDTMNMYDPETEPGGRGQKFSSALDIRMERKGILTDKGVKKGLGAPGGLGKEEDSGISIAAITQFLVKKNKTAPSHRAGNFAFWFAEGDGRKPGDISCGDAIFQSALRYKILVKSGKDYVIVSTGEVLGTKKDEVRDLVKKNRKLLDTLSTLVLERMNGDDGGEAERPDRGEVTPTAGTPLPETSGQRIEQIAPMPKIKAITKVGET